MPELTTVERSSTIAEVGYESESRELTIRFHSGCAYVFGEVPAAEHDALMSAASVGRYFHTHIRGCYPARKLA